MSKVFVSSLIALSIALTSLTGCQTMGRATGRAAEEIEEGAK